LQETARRHLVTKRHLVKRQRRVVTRRCGSGAGSSQIALDQARATAGNGTVTLLR